MKLDDMDKNVLEEIMGLMSKLNADGAKNMSVEIRSKEPADLVGQKDVEALQLPGENPSNIPEGEEDDVGLRKALADDSSEGADPSLNDGDMDLDDEYDSETAMRRKGRIF